MKALGGKRLGQTDIDRNEDRFRPVFDVANMTRSRNCPEDHKVSRAIRPVVGSAGQ